MEKLILPCGRFTPVPGESTEARMRAMEAYLAELSEEVEFLLEEIGRTLTILRGGEEG